jgi:hypothetical protein
MSDLMKKIFRLEKKLEGDEGKSILDEINYCTARQRTPQRMQNTIADIMRNPSETTAPGVPPRHAGKSIAWRLEESHN